MENFSEKRKRGRPRLYGYPDDILGSGLIRLSNSERRRMQNEACRRLALEVLQKHGLVTEYLLKHKTILTELGRLPEQYIPIFAKQISEKEVPTAAVIARCRGSRLGRLYKPTPEGLEEIVWNFTQNLRESYPTLTKPEIAEALDTVSIWLNRPEPPQQPNSGQ